MTYKTFIKDGIIRTFKVDDERVYATLELEGVWISNPSLDTFYACGWSDYVAPEPEPYIPTYAELVERYIRENGYPTYGSELAIINNYTIDPVEYEQDYRSYMQTRVDAKEWATNQPHRDE